MKNFLNKLKNFRKPERNGFEKVRLSADRKGQVENQAFLKLASFQFKELAKRGLSIPVFTL